MDSSRRRLWNELADGQRGMPNAASDFNSASHSSSSSLLSVGNSTTLDELEFLIPGEPILCKVGELHTTEVTFSQVLPKIQNVTPELDLILAGNSFFLPPYLTGRIPEVPAYGQYSEDVICSIIQHFEDRYIFNTVSFILVALGLALIKVNHILHSLSRRRN
ncbi:hypothetical protein PSTG_13693 [Puccinia striiformis f. sp. tritici PST-78]|uniref:Uncharacterized protein n=1 Tax=Puccinia striiformis f. sp. tritici PST-78 TaxID=1165861 RepID=A0A0L0V1L9_9BASI|nr:hypothetical protein PSTG_13693 [Puccinia striiformis f. sp. tritici PST-78]